MKQIQHKQGFILIMALLMISLGMLITSNLFDKGSSYVPYAHTVIDRQKAILLAQTGLAIVESQLFTPPEPDKEKAVKAQPGEKKQQRAPSEQEDMQHLLTTLLPILNTWQTFTFTGALDGFDGILKICLMSEEGKLNINKLYDFKTKKFKYEAKGGGFKTALSAILAEVEKTMHAKELFASLERYLQARTFPLDDVTELLTIKQFDVFKNAIYYTPHAAQTKEKKEKEQSPTYALTDLFTTSSDDAGVNPWLLSQSLKTVLQIPPSTPFADPKQLEQLTQITKQYKPKAQWEKEWDTVLKPVYGIEYNHLPKYTNIAIRESGVARYFSVLIHSTVGDATQQLYVILERIKKSQDNKTVYQIGIRSYYWL